MDNQYPHLLGNYSMDNWSYKSAKVGDKLPKLIIKPISRTTLALYAGASGDFNPIHIDIDYAKLSGLKDVIAHGMLIMGYLGRLLTNNIDQSQILEYGVRFSSMTYIGDTLYCNGMVTEIIKNSHNQNIKIQLSVFDQNDNEKLSGFSIINIS